MQPLRGGPSTAAQGRLSRDPPLAPRALAYARRWLLGWRRVRFTRSGVLYTLCVLAVGFAAFRTGNNLLYLLWGGMLGMIVVSSWASEQVIRELHVRRQTPRGTTVGNPAEIRYEVANMHGWMPSVGVLLEEKGLPEGAFIPLLEPGGHTTARSKNRFVSRGVYPLESINVSTTFPFGLFRKSRELRIKGEIVIWPRCDRRVPLAEGLAGSDVRVPSFSRGPPGPRGEYRGLRPYRPGDDPRDIHWRTTARLGETVVREYEEHGANVLWICLDSRGPPGDQAERLVETAAGLAAQAYQAGRRFALASGGETVEPGQGPVQLERVLDALARVDFHSRAPRPSPPVSSSDCVLLSAGTGFRLPFTEAASAPTSTGTSPGPSLGWIASEEGPESGVDP